MNAVIRHSRWHSHLDIRITTISFQYLPKHCVQFNYKFIYTVLALALRCTMIQPNGKYSYIVWIDEHLSDWTSNSFHIELTNLQFNLKMVERQMWDGIGSAVHEWFHFGIFPRQPHKIINFSLNWIFIFYYPCIVRIYMHWRMAIVPFWCTHTHKHTIQSLQNWLPFQLFFHILCAHCSISFDKWCLLKSTSFGAIKKYLSTFSRHFQMFVSFFIW